MYTNQTLSRFSACLVAACLAAISWPAMAQSRACVIDERNGSLHCGAPADPYGNRIGDFYPSGNAAPVFGNDRLGNSRGDDRRDERLNLAQAQERVNSLFREVLGRTAEYDSLRRYADTVVNGRDLSDVRLELATSPEARTGLPSASSVLYSTRQVATS